MTAAAPNVEIFLGGDSVKDKVNAGDFISYAIERDMFQADMATITLSNKNDIYAGKYDVGAPVVVKIGQGDSIFKGEVVGFEGLYKGGETTKLTIRAMNRMHRMLRSRGSKAFKDQSDQQILEELCKKAQLTLEFKHEKPITYKTVYQHNLSDLEFARMRAARIGCYMWCVDTKLFVKEPDFSQIISPSWSVDKGGNLRTFSPRLSSASVVKKVTVKGHDPEKKELIIGSAEQSKSSLAGKDCVDACAEFKPDETFVVDLPIWTKEEADVLAKARLRDLNMQYITAEAEIASNVDVDLGKVVEIEANAQQKDDPFNGKYYIVGMTHRHTMPKAKEGGQVTILRLARDGQGG